MNIERQLAQTIKTICANQIQRACRAESTAKYEYNKAKSELEDANKKMKYFEELFTEAEKTGDYSEFLNGASL